MKKYLIIATIILLFGGCTTHRKVLKTQSELKIENNIEASNEIVETKASIKVGKTSINESSTIEEVSIKKPVNIELTANFKIDSTAFLRGDTAMKLVDVTDKNVSITIYQNGKTKVLTAKIKTLAGVQDVPFSEINIKKSSTNKTTNIDTSKIDISKQISKSTIKDKSKITASKSSVYRETEKVNYLGLILLLVAVGCLFWQMNKK